MNTTPAGADPYSLSRFIDAQADCWETVRGELDRGRKSTHWMWFIFPQVHGLGSSAMARQFAIRSRAEAIAYLDHPVLGARLRESAAAVLRHPNRTARQIFGPPDDLKLRSSMTLFAAVTGGDSVFQQVLEQFFRGEPDEATLRFLESPSA